MDWLEFSSKIVEQGVKLVGEVIWPSIAAWIAYRYRDQITDLAKYLKKLKAGGFEAEFADQARELKETVATVERIDANHAQQVANATSAGEQAAIAAPSPIADGGVPQDVDPALHAAARAWVTGAGGSPFPYEEVYESGSFQVLSSRPAVGILNAWRDVESALFFTTKHSLQGSSFSSDGPWVEQALESGILRSDLVIIIRQLRTLRDAVAHNQGFEPSKAAVKDYRSTVFYVLKEMRKFAKAWPPELFNIKPPETVGKKMRAPDDPSGSPEPAPAD